jgi:[acyl-carrier-protein] S-malonyltransferase
LCFEGPDEDLRQTKNAQPALVTMSLACLKAAQKQVETVRQIKPAYLLGHSLGEYTALAVAGVLDYPSAIFLAKERGRVMYEAGERSPGAMAAILGLDETAVNLVCKECGVWLANINCPGQLVISGSKPNIEKAIVMAKEKGAARALPLQVSGAFHSPLMQPAAEGLSRVIAGLELKTPSIPVIANTSAAPLMNPQSVKAELLQQLTSTVQWQRSVEYMIQSGVRTFIEIGPGKVLTGLIKRINKEVKLLNIGETSELNNLAG